MEVQQWRDYLAHLSGVYLPRVPVDLVAAAADYVAGVREVITADMRVRPRYEEFEWDDGLLLDTMQVNAAVEAVVLYRIERAIFLEDPSSPMLPQLAALMRLRTGSELYYSTEIGPGFNLMHGAAVVVGPRNRIGHHFSVYQGVTVGQSRAGQGQESCVIGNHVSLFAGSKVLGCVTIGDNVLLGANAVLRTDAEPNGVYVGVPAKRTHAAR